MNIITFDIMYRNTFLQIKNGLILDPLTITRVDQPHYKLGLWLIWQNLIQNVNPANIINRLYSVKTNIFQNAFFCVFPLEMTSVG